MKINLIPLKFVLNKQSYLDLILNCCDFEYDTDGEISKMLNELSENKTNEYIIKLFEFEVLIKDKVIKAISNLDCVKIILDK